MIYCQECGIKNDTSLVICDNCGVKLDPTKTDNLPLEYTLTNEQYSEAINKKNKEAIIKNQLPYAPFQFKILQFVNILSILSIIFIAILLVQNSYPNIISILLILIPAIIITLFLSYCVKALSRYDNRIRKIYLIWPIMEIIFLIWLFFVDGISEIILIGLGVVFYQFYILIFDRQTVDLFLNGIK